MALTEPRTTPSPGAVRPRTDRLFELAAAAAGRPWLPLAALAFIALLLQPVLHIPFFGDDVPGSEIQGYREITGDGAVELALRSTWEFVSDSGRPQLLSAFPGYPALELLGDHRVLYHGYLIAFTVLCAGLLYVLLRRLGVDRPVALAAIVIAGAAIQLRIYHDALMAYTGLTQATFALVLGSLLAFVRWLDEGRGRSLILAVALFVAAGMIYEAAYPLCLLHVGIAFARRQGRPAVRAALPFLAVSLLFVVASYIGRVTASSPVENYTASGGPWTALRTYVIQLFPPLPTSSLLFDPGIAGDVTKAELLGAVWRAGAVGLAVLGLGLAMARARPSEAASRAAVGLGLALWLAPPALLSLSAKYQAEVGPGRGYLPVLLQVFGVALLLAVGMAALLHRAQRRSGSALAVALAGVTASAALAAGVTGFNNLRVAAILGPERESRDLIENAAERGVLDDVDERSTVLFTDRDLLWVGPVPYRGFEYQPLMLADKTGRVFDARREPVAEPPAPCPATPDLVRAHCAPLRGEAVWSRVRVRRDGGTVIVASFDRRPGGSRFTAPAREIWVYHERDGGVEGPPRLVSGAWDSTAVQWETVRRGDGWALFSATLTGPARPVAATLDDAEAIVDFVAMPAPGERVRLLGTKNLLP